MKYLIALLLLTQIAWANDLQQSYRDHHLNQHDHGQPQTQMQLLAYLDLSRMGEGLAKVLQAHVKEASRQAKVREFWMAFYQGQLAAQNIIHSAQAITPKVCQSIETMANTQAAFGLGVKTVAPFCFDKNYFKKLKDMTGALNSLKQDSVKLQLRMDNLSADEVKLEQLRVEIEQEFKTSYLAQLEMAKTQLQKTVALDETILTSLHSKASAVASYINCENLVSRIGERFICEVKVVPSRLTLNAFDAFKILVQNGSHGQFQAQLFLSGLIHAANTFKSEIAPNDQLLDILMDQLKADLSDLDYQVALEVEKVKKSFALALEQKLRMNHIARVVALRSLLQADEREQIIVKLASFKIMLEEAMIWEIGNTFDAKILAQLSAQYAQTLSAIASVESTLSVKTDAILLDLDRNSPVVEIMSAQHFFGPVYLLGVTQADVQRWMSFLSI
jgi:hypothetical protein